MDKNGVKKGGRGIHVLRLPSLFVSLFILADVKVLKGD